MGPFEDPAYIAAEAWYLTPPEDMPVSEYEEPEETFWGPEDL